MKVVRLLTTCKSWQPLVLVHALGKRRCHVLQFRITTGERKSRSVRENYLVQQDRVAKIIVRECYAERHL